MYAKSTSLHWLQSIPDSLEQDLWTAMQSQDPAVMANFLRYAADFRRGVEGLAIVAAGEGTMTFDPANNRVKVRKLFKAVTA